MAHIYQIDDSRPGRNDLPDPDAVRTAREDLAACFRLAALHGLEEGVCNHFSAMIPGSDDTFLVNPLGYAFSEITVSSLLLCDVHGRVLEGSGTPEATAFHIHAQLHMRLPRAKVVFHTHMPYATALAMVEGPPLLWAGQTALRFHGRVAVDENYNGLALDATEGERIALTAGDADIVFLKNHGVVVLADTIAEAWDDLYYLERASQAQVLAASTGRPLKIVPDEIACLVASQEAAGRADSARLHLASARRRLERSDSSFLD